MTNTFKILLTIGYVFLLHNLASSQVKEIKIRYIGNCGLHITDGTQHIYTDFPYKSGAHNYEAYDDSEIDNLKENAFYIFTHKHLDHYSKKLVKKVKKSKGGNIFGNWNTSELTSLDTLISDFKITAFRTKHHLCFKHFSYLMTWHNKKIFISGDTESSDLIVQQKNLDWVFAPAWLLLDAHKKKEKIDSKMVGVYHIGPKDVVNINGEKIVMLKKKGYTISIPYKPAIK